MLWRSTARPDGVERAATTMADASVAAARGDYDTALAIWAKHGQAGNAQAQVEIGNCFLHALGVERNVELAHTWLHLAANAGDPVGQRMLGDFHFNGEEGKPDRAIAEEWYARAARQGDAHAQDMLSWILAEADHRAPDYAEARRWALAAASQGNASSMTRIGLLYHNALGVERDATEAARWWQQAAMLGDADGQAMLGVACHLGAGVPKDNVRALAWLTLARLARSKLADRYYNGVRAQCSAAERREAEELAYLPPETWRRLP